MDFSDRNNGVPAVSTLFNCFGIFSNIHKIRFGVFI